jgi:hypothetical protein
MKLAAAISNDGKTVVVHWSKFELKIYECHIDGTSSLKDTLALPREIRATVNKLFQTSAGDEILDLRFM